MDIRGLKRNPAVIKENFAIVGGKVITRNDCTILIPYNYISHKLAKLGTQIFTISVFAIVVGTDYGVMNACANVELTPNDTSQIKILGEEFIEFKFVKGQTVMPTLTIVKDSDLAYEANRYFYTHGRVPWFMGYEDVARVMKMHNAYCGLSISPNNVPFELIASKICRDGKDKFKYYRHGEMRGNPVVVPFNSVLFNATNTTAKLIGNYLSDGVTSALVSPSDRVETVETLLRS